MLKISIWEPFIYFLPIHVVVFQILREVLRHISHECDLLDCQRQIFHLLNNCNCCLLVLNLHGNIRKSFQEFESLLAIEKWNLKGLGGNPFGIRVLSGDESMLSEGVFRKKNCEIIKVVYD